MAARKRTTTAPMIDELRLLDLQDANPDEIVAHGSYEARRYRSADLAGRDLSGVAFSECDFDGLQVHETQLQGARFIETRIAQGSAAALQASRTMWRDAHIDRSRFGAVELFDAELESVRITGSKLSFVNLRGARLRDVQLDHCLIDELDLVEARAERVAFSDCTVGSIRFDHARLQHVDLRGLEMHSISGVESMRGTIVSSTQALDLTSAFASHLGIAVVD